MASAVSDHTQRGDPRNGGALFTIPREIRDEIYRLLVKRHYIAFPADVRFIDCKCTVCATNTKKPNLAILRVSRDISDEAQGILYSESLFEYVNLDFETATSSSKPPTPVVANRMENIMVSMIGLVPGPTFSFPSGTYPGTIDNVSGYRVLRDGFHIRFSICKPNDIDPVTRHILPRLATLNGFRTILVEVFLQDSSDSYVKDKWGSLEARLEQVRQIVKSTLEPTLGSAISSHDSNTFSLKFHSREHLPSMLRAQVQKMLLDADRLEQGS